MAESANWTPAIGPEPGFVMASAEGCLRTILPEAKRICARQHRSAVREALLAAEQLLAEVDARAYVARIDGLTRAETVAAPEVPEEAGP